MNIRILHLLSGADQAKGTAVVIDVFRVFSLECYLFSRGVEKIYAVGKEETPWSVWGIPEQPLLRKMTFAAGIYRVS